MNDGADAPLEERSSRPQAEPRLPQPGMGSFWVLRVRELECVASSFARDLGRISNDCELAGEATSAGGEERWSELDAD